jgi:hypothetical protein
LDEGEEARVDEAGGVGPAVAVVDADEGGGGGDEHLRLVLERLVGLRHGDGVVAGGVRLEGHVPQQPVVGHAPSTAGPAAAVKAAAGRQPPP